MTRLEQKTDKAIRSSTRSINSLDASLKGAAATARTFATAFGAGALAGGLTQLPGLFREIVAEAAGIGDMAERIGISTDALQALNYQAQQNGSSAEAMGAGLLQLSRRLGEAAQGSGELYKLFQANGVAINDASGKMRPFVDLLGDVADLIANASSESDKAVIAVDAFGKAGGELVLAFASGKIGVEEFRVEAEKLGLILGGPLIEDARKIDDKFDQLAGTLSTMVKAEVLQFFSQLSAAAADIASWMDIANVAASGLNDALDRFGRNAANAVGLGEARAKLGVMAGGGDAYDPSDFDWVNKMRNPNPIRARVTPRATVLPSKASSGGKSEAEREREQAAKAAEREREAVKKLIEDLEFENSLIGQSVEAKKVMTELRRAGSAATTEEAQKIVSLVQAQVAAEAQAEALEEAQKRLNEAMDGIRDAAGNALSAFNDALRNGEGAAGGLNAALQTVLDTVIRIAEEQAIAALFGQSGTGAGGGLGGLIGKFLGGGMSSPNIASVAANSNRAPGGQVEHVIRTVPSPLFVQTVESRVVAGEKRTLSAAPAVAAERQARTG